MGLDYYGILDINRSASIYDIQRAFRKKAIQCNPELNKHNAKSKEIFALACEAYEVLSDPLRRAIYDQFGEACLKKGAPTAYGFTPPFEYDGNTTRTFETFFGTQNPYADLLNVYRPVDVKEERGKNAFPYLCQDNQKENDFSDIPDMKNIKYDHEQIKGNVQMVHVTLKEIYYGCVKLLTVPNREIDECNKHLNWTEKSKILHVEIKPGLPENTVFNFPNGSHEKPHIVIVKEIPHDTFWRCGSNLHMRKTISLKDALTGCSFTVDTLDDRILHVPITDITSCTKNEKIIKSEGMPLLKEPHRKGNLVIHLEIVYPNALPYDVRTTMANLLQKDVDKNNIYSTRKILEDKMKVNAKGSGLSLP